MPPELDRRFEALRLQAVLLARAFSAAHEDQVIELLRHAALEERSPLIRREAIYQLAGMSERVSEPILALAARDPDPVVARAAKLRIANPT